MRSQSEKIALAECIKIFTSSYDAYYESYTLTNEAIAELINVDSEKFIAEYNTRVNAAQLYSSKIDFTSEKDSYFFSKGNLSILQKQKILVLGTRRASSQGKKEVLSIVKAIGEADSALVVSLEQGISLFALSCAVKFKVPVIVVLANPFNAIKKELSLEVINQLDGENILFLSPFYMFEKVEAWSKLIRNRNLENISDKLFIAEELDGGPSWTSCDYFISNSKDVCVPDDFYTNPNLSFSKKLVEDDIIYTYKTDKEILSFIKGTRRSKSTKAKKTKVKLI